MPTVMEKYFPDMLKEIEAAKKEMRCVNCRSRIFSSASRATNMPGGVYSDAGHREYQQSGSCEFCFDTLDEDGDERFEPEYIKAMQRCTALTIMGADASDLVREGIFHADADMLEKFGVLENANTRALWVEQLSNKILEDFRNSIISILPDANRHQLCSIARTVAEGIQSVNDDSIRDWCIQAIFHEGPPLELGEFTQRFKDNVRSRCRDESILKALDTAMLAFIDCDTYDTCVFAAASQFLDLAEHDPTHDCYEICEIRLCDDGGTTD